MHITIVLAHPNPGSFNHAIAQTAAEQLRQNGHVVALHDLYQEGFEALLPASELASDCPLPPELKARCEETAKTDGLIFVHPNWWGMPPAILTGWIDRVLRQKVAYKFVAGDNGEGVPVGLLRARAAIVFNTSNTPPEREAAAFGDPLELLWKRCILDLCGVKDVERRMFSVVITSTVADRVGWLEEVRHIVNTRFPRG